RRSAQRLFGRNFLTMRASGSDRTIMPRASRMNLLERLIMPWRLPAAEAFTRPEAVSLKRFLAADLVFILGILLLHTTCPRDRLHDSARGLKALMNRHGMPCRAVRERVAYKRLCRFVQWALNA